MCKQKPSEYITHGNWFFAIEPEEGMLPYVIERIGGRKDISESAKEKILGKNANALYGWND